jgi:hypothetical protein
MHNSLYKLSTKHFIECIDQNEVAWKTLTNQSWRAAGIGVGEATGGKDGTDREGSGGWHLAGVGRNGVGTRSGR